MFADTNPSPQSIVPEYVPLTSYGNVILSDGDVVLHTDTNDGGNVGVGVGVFVLVTVGVTVGVIVLVGVILGVGVGVVVSIITGVTLGVGGIPSLPGETIGSFFTISFLKIFTLKIP